MKIVLTKGFNSNSVDEYLLNDWSQIEELFDSINWTEFHIFTINYDDRNSIDISGNTSEDGLSGSLTRDGIIHITPDPPQSLTVAKWLLKSFLNSRDQTYEKYFKEKEALPIRPIRNEGRFFRWIMVLFFVSIVAIPIIYFSWNDLKFIGRDVGYARAKVDDIKIQSYGCRFFWQKVTYHFEIDGLVFSGTFKGGSRQGYTNHGDEFKVRYLISDPGVNDFIGRFVKRKQRINNSSKEAKRTQFSKKGGINSQTENVNLDSLNTN